MRRQRRLSHLSSIIIYHKRRRKIMNSQLNGKNKIHAIYALPVIKYAAGIVRRINEEMEALMWEIFFFSQWTEWTEISTPNVIPKDCAPAEKKADGAWWMWKQQRNEIRSIQKYQIALKDELLRNLKHLQTGKRSHRGNIMAKQGFPWIVPSTAMITILWNHTSGWRKPD